MACRLPMSRLTDANERGLAANLGNLRHLVAGAASADAQHQLLADLAVPRLGPCALQASQMRFHNLRVSRASIGW